MQRKRNYKKEYKQYHETPLQKKKRASRNKARRAFEKANKAVTYPQVHQAKPFCQVIPGTEQPDKVEI